MTAFTWLIGLSVRGTVVLAVAIGLGLLLRRSSAVARHRLWTLTALGLLALPVLTALLPSFELPLALPRLGPVTVAPAVAVVPPAAATALADEHAAAASGTLAATAPPRVVAPGGGLASYRAALGGAVVVAWLIGVVAALAGLCRALRRERRLLAQSRPLAGPWLAALDEARIALAVARPVRLLTSDAIETPITGGWPRPAVLLPPIAAHWPEERQRLVVQHELVHIVRGDGLRRLAWRLVGALYWFHPLARIAERHARLAGEHACDETVVELGTRPSDYARHLLDIAEALRSRQLGLASALPMIDRSQLERRLVMILDTNRVSGRGRTAALACLSFLALTVLGVAATAPARPERAVASEAVAGAPQAATPAASAQRVAAAAPVRADQPLRRARPGTACMDGFSGTSIHRGSSDEDDYGDFSLQHQLGDGQRLCAQVHGPVLFDERSGAIRELPRGSSVLIETRELQKSSQRMLITEEQGEPRYEWWLNGSAQPVDDDARAWLEDALEAVAAFRAMGEIQGEVGSLQGQIGAIQGQIGALQGRIGAIQGEQGSLQGKIGAIQGEQGSLQGQIGSHQGAIGSLQGARGSASADLRKQIDREIQQHEAAIQKLEAEKDDGALSRRLSEAEADLQAFQEDSRGKIAELERQIHAMRSENAIGGLEKEIEDLHAEDRIDEIKRGVAPTIERLKTRIRKLGS